MRYYKHQIAATKGQVMDKFTLLSIKRIETDINNLKNFGATSDGGVTRLPFTKEDKDARNYLVNAMKKAGLNVRIDTVGSIIGRLEGNDPKLPTVLIGSHYDSVINGGSLDGLLGIVAGIEAVRVIKEQNISLSHSIEIIAFSDEEGVRFGGGFLGSRAMTGELGHDELFSFHDENGVSLREAMESQLFNPQDIKASLKKPVDIKAFLELHIEQGPVLDKNNIDVGIVTSIVGMQRYTIEIIGRPDHAGTTPMDMRLDPLSLATKVISKISSWATVDDPEAVATVGSLKVEPCAVNIVPGKVTFTLDIRARDICHIHRLIEKVISMTEELCGKDYKFNIEKNLDVKPAYMADYIQNIIEEKIKEKGYSYKKMHSGAGHDALIMSHIADTALIFVPSKNGRSHSPEEYTNSVHLLMGTEILYETIVELAK